MERSKVGPKKCKGNEVKLVNSNTLRFSCVSWIEDGNIPEWLLLELLVRLPVKSVFRFKLVSRMWLSVISDPYFVRLYVSRASLLSQQPWAVLHTRMLHKDSQFSHLDYELLKDLYVKPSLCAVRLPSIHRSQEEEKYIIFGVSNGLVVYCRYMGSSLGYADRNYYICNPLIGHCIILPPLFSKLESFAWGFHTHVEEGLLKSYTVVQLEPIRGSGSLKFHVYVSEVGEWKDFYVPCNPFPFLVHLKAVVLNGILHWIAEGLGIIAYDPYQNPENMDVIAFPGDIGGHDEFGRLCVEYRGKLRYFEVGGSIISGVAFPSFKVWALNDSGDWCLVHNISHVDIQFDAKFPSSGAWCLERFRLLCFHPFDLDIVYFARDVRCVSYNIKTRKLQFEDEFFRHSENVLENMPYWWMNSILFVIPHWPISIPSPSHGAMKG